jgi:hypothetical protein
MRHLRNETNKVSCDEYIKKLQSLLDTDKETSTPTVKVSWPVINTPIQTEPEHVNTPAPTVTFDTTTHTTPVVPAPRVAGSSEQRNKTMSAPQVLETTHLNFENKEENPDGLIPFIDIVPFKEERKKFFHGFVAVESPFDQLETSICATPSLDAIILQKPAVSNAIILNKKDSAKELIN